MRILGGIGCDSPRDVVILSYNCLIVRVALNQFADGVGAARFFVIKIGII